MLGTHNLTTYLVASLFVWLTPGPDTMFILARSIAQGWRGGLLSVLGIGSGLFVHTAFAAFGLSALLATSALAFEMVKYAGAFYLIYLGIQAWRKRSRGLESPSAPTESDGRIFRQAAISNVLNPKVAFFFLAFLPQFVDPVGGRGPAPFLLLGGLFVTGGTIWCLIVALFAAKATHAIRQNPAAIVWLNRLSGCVYIGLGLNLLRSRPAPAPLA